MALIVALFVLTAPEPDTVELIWPELDCPTHALVTNSLVSLGLQLSDNGRTVVDARVLKDGAIEIAVTTAGRGGTRTIHPDGTCTEIAFRIAVAIERLARPLGECLTGANEAPSTRELRPPPPASSRQPMWGVGAALALILDNELRSRPGVDLSLTRETSGLADWRLRLSLRWPHREDFGAGTVTAHEILMAAGIRSKGRIAWGGALVGQLIATSASGFANNYPYELRFNLGLSAGVCLVSSGPIEVCTRAWAFTRTQELGIDNAAAMRLPHFGGDLTIGTLLWF